MGTTEALLLLILFGLYVVIKVLNSIELLLKQLVRNTGGVHHDLD